MVWLVVLTYNFLCKKHVCIHATSSSFLHLEITLTFAKFCYAFEEKKIFCQRNFMAGTPLRTMALVWTQWRDHSETKPPISQLHLMSFWLVEGSTAFHYQCHISIRIAPTFDF